jgi:hypothetical protein
MTGDQAGARPLRAIDDTKDAADRRHVSRTHGGPDQFTVDCPCEKGPCGFAIATMSSCPQHSLTSGKTIRFSHSEESCTAVADPSASLEFGVVYSTASTPAGAVVGSYPTRAAAIEEMHGTLGDLYGSERNFGTVVSRFGDGTWVDISGQKVHEIQAMHRPLLASPEPAYTGMHITRSFAGPDQWTPDCPCEVAPCGYAIATMFGCRQHSAASGNTIRGGHSAANCTGAPA